MFTKDEFNKLSDEEKFNEYNSTWVHYKSTSDTLNAIVEHLLGENWYACDTGSDLDTNPIVLATIKRNYPDVNKSWSRKQEKIKQIIKS